MAEREYLAERLRYQTEVFRLVWLSILAIGGGVSSLLLGELTPLRVIFAATGTLAVVALLSILYRLQRSIEETLVNIRRRTDA